MNKVTILGINGHIGHHAAIAFVAAGWQVTGFGRSNKHPIAGVSFAKGDAEDVEDMRRAIGGSEVVVNALHLPYHQWTDGRMEALHSRVIAAMGTDGKTMMFPGTIYNYAATDRVVTPDLPQRPQMPRGEIRKRSEALIEAATKRGDIRGIVLRAGDFYGPDNASDWFDQVVFREPGKRKLELLGVPGIGHSWAYLPDLGRAFEKLAWHRNELKPFENFHFAGDFVTPEQMGAAMIAAAPVPMKMGYFPRIFFTLMGITNPILRDIAKMGYLWSNPMELKDDRLDTLLGPNFATPFDKAIAASIAQFFPAEKQAA
jgi:nucleoside-diphosphate-sugar epimerase